MKKYKIGVECICKKVGMPTIMNLKRSKEHNDLIKQLYDNKLISEDAYHKDVEHTKKGR